ncbi:MAG: glycosyltransferase family 4 protein, partial [Deltaproteobacteria bacterium]|nr:glycosyltransferase family 4 protein [Deltaproteobacteria bacterium]
MRIAIVHDWLTGMRGGERCLEVFCELFPEADLFTLLHVKGSVSPKIEAMKIRTSFVQNLPFSRKGYRSYLPLFPLAVESFDLKGYDLVLSSSHC